MPERQQQILAQGKDLLQMAADSSLSQGMLSGWLQRFLQQLNQHEGFRIRALRFIDVLPTLADDAEIIQLFNEYFTRDELPLPALGKVAIKSSSLLGKHALAAVIRHAVKLLATQYMAGADHKKILEIVSDMYSDNRKLSLDLLGELTLTDKEADQYASAYLLLLDSLSTSGQSDLQCSIKLSSLCPRMKPLDQERGRDEVMGRLRPILLKAKNSGIGITLDMEDFSKVPIIKSVFKHILFEHDFAQWEGIGLALQAYLKTIDQDVDEIVELARQRQVPFYIRLVRGAYWDQEMVFARQNQWPVPVWPTQADTDIAFESAIDKLLVHFPLIKLAVATHNPRSLAVTMQNMKEKGLSKDQVEFQMLYGMTPQYQQALINMGYSLRVYLPFGELIPGMAYLVRRLLENASSQSIERWQQNDVPVDELFSPPEKAPRDCFPNNPDFINCATRRFIHRDERERFLKSIEEMQQRLGQDYPLIINGRPIETTARIHSFNPANTDQVVGITASAGKAEADMAVNAALSAHAGWCKTTVFQRAELLRKTADALNDRRDRFSAIEIFEAGKNWSEADADVCEAIDFLNYYADQAEQLFSASQINMPGEENQYYYQARGVSVVIPPWNFPLAILTGMLAASAVTGNCSIVKPASDTPVIAAHLISLMHEVGFPAGVINYLPGAGSSVGEYLVQHPDIHIIAFTGSLEVGKHILQQAAMQNKHQHHFKKVIAEMGGKNAIIVDGSADPDEAISGILHSAFGFQGQKCSACSRVIVVGGQYEKFCERLADATDSLIIDDPVFPHADLGPVINKDARDRILDMISEGQRSGKLYYQADIAGHSKGYYVPPSLFKDVSPDSALAQEEIFGPVVSLIPAKDLDQALQIANNTQYALTGGIYSRGPESLKRARYAFHVGNLYLNRGITGALVNRQPFGGQQMSGVGYKAGGGDYLLQFVEAKCITENTLRRGVAPLV